MVKIFRGLMGGGQLLAQGGQCYKMIYELAGKSER